MQFTDNFVPIKNFYDSFAFALADPNLKIWLSAGRGRMDGDDEYIREIFVSYMPDIRADRLLRPVTMEDIAKYAGSLAPRMKEQDLGKMITATSGVGMKRLTDILFQTKATWTGERPGEYVARCLEDYTQLQQDTRIIGREDIPVVSENAEAFLIHILHVLTNHEAWDEEMRELSNNPLIKIPPKTLTFIIKKSLADRITRLTGQQFKSSGWNEAIFLQREGRL